jgi:hypothetical protein
MRASRKSSIRRITCRDPFQGGLDHFVDTQQFPIRRETLVPAVHDIFAVFKQMILVDLINIGQKQWISWSQPRGLIWRQFPSITLESLAGGIRRFCVSSRVVAVGVVDENS